MRGVAVLSLALALFATSCEAISINARWRVDALRARAIRRRIGGVYDASSRTSTGARERWFAEQRLDHFDNALNASWTQRYFVNDAYASAERGAPVFVCVGGEGPALDVDVAVDGGAHCAIATALAKKHRGLFFALEHRFYGKSQPTGDLSVESLRFLSSAQALEDLVTFTRFAAAAYGLEIEPRNDGRKYSKVIAFGGSYPGMLAAWSRVKFPHVFHAAVASSAPVRAEVDMRGYYDSVGDALREKDVGGSDACYAAVENAFSVRLNEALKTSSGRRELEKQFNVCGNETLDGVGARDDFADVLRAMFPAQNNDPSCLADDDSCFNIAKACTIMTSHGEDKLAALAAHVAAVFRGECMSLDSEAYMRKLKSEIPNPKGEGERQWTWQTCTEFAFFQTCEKSSKCPFKLDPPTMPLEAYHKICADVFGVSAEQTRMAVERSNARYGSITPGGTRIMFPSGSVDPWIANSFVSDTFAPRFEPALIVKGASHHAWTHPPKDTDTDSLVEARAIIVEQVEKWLNEGPMVGRRNDARLRVAEA